MQPNTSIVMPHKIILLSFFLLGFSLSPYSLYSQSLEYTDCFLDDCASPNEYKDITFGYFYVHENHADPNSRLLRLAFAKLEATGQNNKNPLLFLDGGPGGRTLLSRNIRHFSAHPFREEHDIYLLDFRGIGYSEPQVCPGFENQLLLTITQNLSPEQSRQLGNDIFFECFESLINNGLDMNQFSTATVVRDLEVFRNALGIAQWNLWGISYGTRVAQTYMRDYPGSVRAAILDSPVPVGFNLPLTYTDSYRNSLDELFAACANNPLCNSAFPSLEEDFYKIMESLKTDPFIVETPAVPQGYAALNFSDVHLIIHQLLYLDLFYPVFPWFIKGIAERDAGFIKNLLPALQNRLFSASRPINLLVTRYDLGPLYTEMQNDPTDQLYQSLQFFDTDYYVKGKMNFFSIDSLEGQPVVSDVPSLILAGEVDPITPPVFAYQIEKHLKNSFLFVFPGQGHGVTMLSDCAKEIALQFLSNSRSIPQSSCIEQLGPTPISWIPTMYFNTGVATMVNAATRDFNIWTIGGIVLLVLGFITSMVAFIVNFFRKKTIGSQLYKDRILIRATAFIFILLFSGLFYFVKETASLNGLQLLFGLVPQARWLFVLSVVAVAASAFSLYYVVKSFSNHSFFQRIISILLLISFIWCSALVFNYQLWPW